MKTKIITLALFASFSLLFSCKNDDDATPATPLAATTFSNLAADPTVNAGTGQPQAATGSYTLFSFKTGGIIANSDSATNKWDIGFRSTRVIFNGGTSGPGVAALSLQSGIFDDITSVSDTMTFNSDNGTTLALTASSGKGWYTYNSSTNIISPIAGKVLIIKTGDGKYAKMEIVSYYKDAPTAPDATTSISRYYTFRYIYQPDGSKNLK